MLFLLSAVDRYQKYVGKVLLSPPGSSFEVHKDLISAKTACLELRKQCTGVTVWNNAYALARGTVLIRSEESSSAAYVKSGRLRIPNVLWILVQGI